MKKSYRVSRMELLEMAQQEAYFAIDANSALSDRVFVELSKQDPEIVARRLAKKFLQEAADSIED